MVVFKLPKIEITLYICVWIAAVFYSSYKVYQAGKLFDYSDIGDDFQTSWYGFKKDVVDYEWTNWLPFILYSLLPWIAVHIIITDLTRWISPQVIPGTHCFITLLFLFLHYGPAFTVFPVLQVFVYYLILRLKSVSLVWLFGVPFLLISCFALEQLWIYTGKDELTYTMMIISTTWLQLHCASFSLEMLASQDSSRIDNACTFYDLLGYCFYLPTYFLGPFIIYTSFRPYMYKPLERWAGNRVMTFVFNMLRYLFWAALTEAALHLLYIHALQYHLQTVIQLGDWTFYGLGFLMGQFFYMKYVVVYGLLSTIANFDGYDAPPPPKCVARIHLYTDMWRFFDVGFYQFIHKYIYTPICAGHKHSLRRLMASAVCFGFVFIWHGLQLSVFIWSLLNYFGVSLVSIATNFTKTTAYKNWESRTLSEANSRRLSALVAAPLFVMSPVSSFYFFSSIHTGNTYVVHLFLNGSWSGVLGLLFVAYCMCQVSIETKIWDEMRPNTKKHI